MWTEDVPFEGKNISINGKTRTTQLLLFATMPPRLQSILVIVETKKISFLNDDLECPTRSSL